MICKNIEKVKVQISEINEFCEFSLIGIISQMQNTISNHTLSMGVDFTNMTTKSNAFWVILRSTICLYNAAKWGDEITIETYPLKPGIVRCERETIITNSSGEIIATEVTDWCLLDVDTSRPRRVSSTIFPKDLEYKTERVGYSAKKILHYDDMQKVHSRTIRLTDLDFNGHTNNKVYTRLAFDTFPSEKLRTHRISEYSVNFEKQSYEGDEIDVYQSQVCDNIYVVRGINSRTGVGIFTSEIKFVPR